MEQRRSTHKRCKHATPSPVLGVLFNFLVVSVGLAGLSIDFMLRFYVCLFSVCFVGTLLGWLVGCHFYTLSPHAYCASKDVAECTFVPRMPFLCEAFRSCESFGRLIFMDGSWMLNGTCASQFAHTEWGGGVGKGVLNVVLDPALLATEATR